MDPQNLGIKTMEEMTLFVSVVVRTLLTSVLVNNESEYCADVLRILQHRNWIAAFDYIVENTLIHVDWDSMSTTFEMAYVESFSPSQHIHALLFNAFSGEGCRQIHDYMKSHASLTYFSTFMTVLVGQTDVCETDPELGLVLSKHNAWMNLPMTGLPAGPVVLSQNSASALANADTVLLADEEEMSLSSPEITNYLNRSLIEALERDDSSFGEETLSAPEILDIVEDYNVMATGSPVVSEDEDDWTPPDMRQQNSSSSIIIVSSEEDLPALSWSSSPRQAQDDDEDSWQNAQRIPSPESTSEMEVEASAPVSFSVVLCLLNFLAFWQLTFLAVDLSTNVILFLF